ncbi:MAG TPA: PEP-CTERM sorting domain-containing protein, partial [Lacipirellula sp.]
RGGQDDDADPATSGANVTGPAGVVFSQPNWNNVGGNNPDADWDATVAGLLNSAGANSGASITWSTDETWASTANGQAGDPGGNQDRNLMDGYIDAIASQPTATATLDNIPYSAYDVYVYVGSDGDNRTGRVQINNSITSDRWFRTSTAAATFTSAANYIQATAKTEAASVLSNYVVYQDVIGSTLNVGVTRGSNNVGLHGIQLVQESNPQVLTLEVDPASGLTRIRNTTAAPIDLDFFEVTSASSALDEAGWTPLGSGTNDGSDWEVLGNLNDSILAQFFLDGQGTLGPGQSLSLGSAFDGAAQDLAFRYNDPDSFTRTGLVSYGAIVGVDGDFDGDQDVDGGDFLTWQRGLGSTHNAADLADWKANFGTGAGGSAAVAAVPEPTSVMLFTAAVGGLALLRRRNPRGASRMVCELDKHVAKRFLAPAAALVITACFAASAAADLTNDRVYKLGEGAGENGSPSAIVGSGVTVSGAGDSLDDVGPSGAFIDLFLSGDPVYVDVASGPKARSGATGVGVQFDGVNDALTGTPLNRPDNLETVLRAQSNNTGLTYPHDYEGITERGLQGWVYPDQAGLNAGAYQSIVFDSIESGGPAITADGKWTQSNSFHVDGAGGVPASVPVVGNQWSHVMHHNYSRGSGNFRSVVYVNGIAVSATDDGIGELYTDNGDGTYTNTSFDTQNGTGYAHKLVVGAAELEGDSQTPVYGHYFQGAIDNLEMYVVGGTLGAFDLFSDNKWIANEIAATVPGGVLTPGDVNRDGSVNGTGTGPATTDDVTAFVAGWRDRKTFQGAHNALTAGDWETWGWGDMDHDGIVGFSDWFILRANHPTPASLNLGALLGAVPEPSSAMLGGLALLGAGLVRRRSRTR